MQLNYISYHKSINEYAENILPLGVLNFKNDIQLFTTGFADLRNNKNKNLSSPVANPVAKKLSKYYCKPIHKTKIKFFTNSVTNPVANPVA